MNKENEMTKDCCGKCKPQGAGAMPRVAQTAEPVNVVLREVLQELVDGMTDVEDSESRVLYRARAALAAADAAQPVALTFDDAVRIAQGCTDYGGGYRGTPEFDAYQDGISTVIAALKAAEKRGVEDTQVAALHRIGADDAAQPQSQPQPLTVEAIRAAAIDAHLMSNSDDLPGRLLKFARAVERITAGTEGGA